MSKLMVLTYSDGDRYLLHMIGATEYDAFHRCPLEAHSWVTNATSAPWDTAHTRRYGAAVITIIPCTALYSRVIFSRNINNLLEGLPKWRR